MAEQTPEERLTRVEDAIIQHADFAREVRTSISKISDALVTLATLEVKHSETRAGLERLTKSHDENEKRISVMEVSLPPLLEARMYLMRGAAGVIGAVGLALVGLVLVK